MGGSYGIETLRRRMRMLGFPLHADFDVEDDLACKNFVVWCEERVIRLLDSDQRKRLRDSPFGGDAVHEYLSELDCPAGLREHTRRFELLEWLVEECAWIGYGDVSSTYTGGQPSDPRPGPTAHAVVELREMLTELGQLMGLPDPSLDDATEEVSAAVRRAVTSRADLASERPVKYTVDLDWFPPPAGTDASLGHVAQVMQHLYAAELRSLQHHVNDSIRKLQQKTADLSRVTRNALEK